MNQEFLLLPDVRDWLPEGHLALFVNDTVDELDLSKIYVDYKKGDYRGRPPYHPLMMVKLLVFAYCNEKLSSMKIELAIYDEVVYRSLSGNQHPDYDSSSPSGCHS